MDVDMPSSVLFEQVVIEAKGPDGVRRSQLLSKENRTGIIRRDNAYNYSNSEYSLPRSVHKILFPTFDNS